MQPHPPQRKFRFPFGFSFAFWLISILSKRFFVSFPSFRSAQQAQNNAAQAGFHASVGLESKPGGGLEADDLALNHNYGSEFHSGHEYSLAGY